MKNPGVSCVRPVDTIVSETLMDYDGSDRGGVAGCEVDHGGSTRGLCPVEMSYAEEIHAAPAEDPPVKVVKDPGMPTKAEYDGHMCRGHLPFRSWCPFCVMGNAPEDPHWKKKESNGR